MGGNIEGSRLEVLEGLPNMDEMGPAKAGTWNVVGCRTDNQHQKRLEDEPRMGWKCVVGRGAGILGSQMSLKGWKWKENVEEGAVVGAGRSATVLWCFQAVLHPCANNVGSSVL